MSAESFEIKKITSTSLPSSKTINTKKKDDMQINKQKQKEKKREQNSKKILNIKKAFNEIPEDKENEDKNNKNNLHIDILV